MSIEDEEDGDDKEEDGHDYGSPYATTGEKIWALIQLILLVFGIPVLAAILAR